MSRSPYSRASHRVRTSFKKYMKTGSRKAWKSYIRKQKGVFGKLH